MLRPKTLREQDESRIARKRRRRRVLDAEFRDLGVRIRFWRALRTLVREKRLVRLGYGVYGRAVVSRLSGDPILYSRTDFRRGTAGSYKLGVTWEPSRSRTRLHEGRSTQIPPQSVVRVKGRFSRRLRDGNQELVVAR